jgi:hypothetical protein
MTTAKKQSVANAYKQHVAGKELSLVDVTLPSGFVFKFRKPSAFQVLFQAGELPQTLSSAAVERWIEDGIITPDEDTPEAKADLVKQARTAMNIRDRVLELSYKPKLVVGPAKDETELSTTDVDDDDLEYLYRWVATGGVAGLGPATFPARPQENALASASRPNERHAAEPVSGS